MKNILIIAILAGLAWLGYGKYKAATRPDALIEPAAAQSQSQYAATTDQPHIGASTSPSFKCDGRTHCSQMTSCAEATYFIQHCPNTKMDGNNDGEPCEEQWCN